MRYLILACGVIGAVLVYMLAGVGADTNIFSRNYFSLLVSTAFLAATLFGLVIYQVWQLRRKLLQHIYGAKLTLRLTLFFISIAVLPGLMVYAVSAQFLGKSIESWFDVRVEKALEGGLSLARGTLQNGLDELRKKAQFVSLILAEQEPARHKETLSRLIAEGGVQEAAIFGNYGELLAATGDLHDINLPSSIMLQKAWREGFYGNADTLTDERLMLRVIVPIHSERWPSQKRLLQFYQPVPEQLANDAETVRAVYLDYQQLSLSRLGLKRMYVITLTLSLLIVLLSAMSAAFYFSEQLSAPLAALAAGAQAVAQGDFSKTYPVQSKDELGSLTQLFNQMTAQLASAKKLAEQQQRQVENTKTYLESILARLSSGVLVIDERHKLRSVNPSASQILGVPAQKLTGKNLIAIATDRVLLRPLFEAIQHALEREQQAEWRLQLETRNARGDQVLLLRGTRLDVDHESSHVVVFDDITHLLQAERQAAWGEVARRLAHEIKNPLMPIRLSAERLQYKLHDKLEDTDARLLQRATQTIVNQVTAMNNMVSDFADYARAPAPVLNHLDMHQLLIEVLGLYEANSSLISLELKAARAQIKGDATRLRQVVHNLLQNALDALQSVQNKRIVLATSNISGAWLKLSIADNGGGFTEHMLTRAFEPYMTTKPKGTGLGLPIVKKIIEELGGSISLENLAQGGACINILLPLLETEVA